MNVGEKYVSIVQKLHGFISYTAQYDHKKLKRYIYLALPLTPGPLAFYHTACHDSYSHVLLRMNYPNFDDPPTFHPNKHCYCAHLSMLMSEFLHISVLLDYFK